MVFCIDFFRFVCEQQQSHIFNLHLHLMLLPCCLFPFLSLSFFLSSFCNFCVTWLIKIQVKIIIFRFSFRFVSWALNVLRTPFIITLLNIAKCFCIKSISSLNKFSCVRLATFFLLALPFCFSIGFSSVFDQIKSLFIYTRRKSFWLKLCSTVKTFLMIYAAQRRGQLK